MRPDPIDPGWRERNAANAWKLERRASKAGVSLADYRERAETNLQAWTSGAVRIRLCEGALRAFLRDGRYKVMAETGKSGGSLKHAETRLRLEGRMLGLAPSQSGEGRPISAYLEGSDESGAITTYGPIILELHPKVRDRCWFVLGDLVDDVTKAFDSEVFCPARLTAPAIIAAHLDRDIATPKALADACGDLRYAEVLLVDGLVPSDVAVVLYPHDLQPDATVVQLLPPGIPVYQGDLLIRGR